MVRVRLATQEDNYRLLELARETPMKGAMSIEVDRSPDYFRLSKLQGSESKIFVAEQSGKLLGVVGCAFRNVSLFGKETCIAYVGGIKVRESAKKGFSAFHLMKNIRDYLYDSKARLAILLVLNDNNEMVSILSGRAGIPRFYLINKYRISYLLYLYSLRISNNYLIRESTQSDLKELASLFSEFYSKMELSPIWAAEKLSSIIETEPNFSYENILVALSNDSIVAAVSIWDQSSFKKTIVLRYSGFLKYVKSLHTPFNLLPPAGESLSELLLRHIVYKPAYLDATIDLVRSAVNKNRRRYKFIRAGTQERSEIAKCLKGWPRISIGLSAYVAFQKDFENVEDTVFRLRESQIWEDLSLH